jgi:DNA-directed RNA polymerase specialized sigma24 family protein
MDTQELVSYLDDLLFSSTGDRIDSLQVAILKGVLNGQKYADIAKEYKCSAGHVKDEAYKFWKLLSDTLGEEVNKSNFRATVQRLGFANFQSPIVGNKVRVKNINLCSNSSNDKIEESDDILEDDQVIADAIQKKTKRETIPRLVTLGLTPEQIAEALDLSLQEVKKITAIQEPN